MNEERFQLRQKQPIGIDKLMELDLNTLAEEMDRLQHSIMRLISSNAEILEFEKEEEDLEARQVYQQARTENLETITCQKERVEMIKWTIQQKLGRPMGTKNSHYNQDVAPQITKNVTKIATTSNDSDPAAVDQSVELDSENGISL